MNFFTILVIFILVDLSQEECKDKFKVYPAHSACVSAAANSRPGVIKTPEALKAHNKYRAQAVTEYGVVNMMNMVWDTEIAMVAQKWAEKCTLGHDENRQRFIPGRFTLGQNIAINKNGPMTWDNIVNLWYKEKSEFTYGSTALDFMKVGHFTQLVWAESYILGCGYSICGGTHYYVCNYGPTGNSPSNALGKPFKKSGSTCKKSTTDKLCDCGNIVCGGNSKLNHTNCQCSCPNSLYTSPTCTLSCHGKKDSATCGVSYTADKCIKWSNVAFNCPYLCKVCPYAEQSYVEGSTKVECVTGVSSCGTSSSNGNGSGSDNGASKKKSSVIYIFSIIILLNPLL